VIEVRDRFRPTSGGTFRLTAAGRSDVASCERLTATGGNEPDLTLEMSDLSSIALGAVAPSQLAAAGRIATRDPDALDLADALFTPAVSPYCPVEF
jgi:predicted acetyltransferase